MLMIICYTKCMSCMSFLKTTSLEATVLKCMMGSAFGCHRNNTFIVNYSNIRTVIYVLDRLCMAQVCNTHKQ